MIKKIKKFNNSSKNTLTNKNHLNKPCQICLSTNYREDESGFYSCS